MWTKTKIVVDVTDVDKMLDKAIQIIMHSTRACPLFCYDVCMQEDNCREDLAQCWKLYFVKILEGMGDESVPPSRRPYGADAAENICGV